MSAQRDTGPAELTERTPPTPAEEAERAAERAICGAILDDPHGLHFAAALGAGLALDALQHPAHRAIWSVVAELREQGRAVDQITASAALAPVFSKPAYKGYDSAWLAALPQAPALPESTAEHAQIVLRGSLQRQRAAIVAELARRPQDAGLGDLPARLDAAEQRIRELDGQARRGAAPLETVCMANVAAEQVEWLWESWIPFGKLSVLDGDPGLGKSTLSLAIGAAVTTGAPLPGGRTRPPRTMVLISTEDGYADTIRPRLEAARADLGKVQALSTGFRLPDDVPRLEALIRRHQAAMVVIDPLMAVLNADINSHRDQDIRAALAPLAAMADRTRCAVVIIRHLNKSGGGSALYRGGGSIGISGAARSVMLWAQDPDEKDGRILARVKCNLAPPVRSLRYRMVSMGAVACVEYVEEVDMSADELLLQQDQNKGKRSALREAEDVLRAILASGPVASAEAEEQAKQMHVQRRTLWRAKNNLKVRASRQGGRWFWSLPAADEGEK